MCWLASAALGKREAQRLIVQCLPDVAFVDFHLRGGEESSSLIISLRLAYKARRGLIRNFAATVVCFGKGAGRGGG